mmetsp:Transcript_4353/g.4898  ORF Transcript_4353/g.4898 Transcript_4353/m.4898 type:complete len:531 (-) Transcript_4353:117-1709(-)
MERSLIISLAVMVTINITDSVTNSVISPTLTFYIDELGGTLEQYGMVMSADSLAMLFMVSIFGRWVDTNGNQYKTPYMFCFATGILGQLMYFSVILLPKGNIAIGGAMIARFVVGLGAAGKTLSYSYVATAVPREQQKTCLTLLSMSRTVGMAVGPLVNMVVIKINTQINIGNMITIPVNPYNAAGLLIAAGEVFLLFVMLLLLQEPPKKENKKDNEKQQEQENQHASWKEIAKAMCSIDLILPPAIVFLVMWNFSTVIVGLPPVARHALGWNPVQISYMSSGYSVALLVSNFMILYLSTKGVSDYKMLVVGHLGFAVFGSAVYFMWAEQVTAWGFALPVFLEILSYPWIGPANRSKYTLAVHERAELAGSHGVMQGFLTQAMTIAGFIGPTLISTFVLRDPAEIEASSDKHELSKYALVGPFLSGLVIVALCYEKFISKKDPNEIEEASSSPSETNNLLSPLNNKARRSSILEISDTFSRASEVNRRLSAEIGGLSNPFDNKGETTLREKLLKDKDEWKAIHDNDTFEE